MGQILKDNVAWLLTFLGILATLTSAAIMELRSDVEALQIKVTALEVYIHGIEKRPYGRKPITLEHSGVDETQAR